MLINIKLVAIWIMMFYYGRQAPIAEQDETNTITTPPAKPEANRQPKYHASEIGKAQARKAAVITTIMARKVRTFPIRPARDRPSSAPQT